jgi:hypothetical protein
MYPPRGYGAMPVVGGPIAYGTQPQYGMPQNMYQQPYGRGYAPAAPAAYTMPPQGMWNEANEKLQKQ